jgi:hypothetical protein
VDWGRLWLICLSQNGQWRIRRQEVSTQQQEPNLLKEYEMNLEMWRHYDRLRQEKNRTFLTVNTILVAAVGFALRDRTSGPSMLVLLVSVLGVLVSLLWFLLVSRNSAYVQFHRDRLRDLEPSVRFNTFSRQADALRNSRLVFKRLSSSVIDRLLATFVAAFWLAILFVSRTL